MDTSGFYTYDHDTGEGFYAPNAVYSRDYELHRDQHTEYTYPDHGWYWFDSLKDGQKFFDTDYDFGITEQL